MVALTGTGRLADDIYLLAHHEVSGRPSLQPRAIGLGLAGGLLAELVLAGAIGLASEGFAATDRVRPENGLTRAVQLQMLRERQRHCVRDWLTFLPQAAAADVARRLERQRWWSAYIFDYLWITSRLCTGPVPAQ